MAGGHYRSGLRPWLLAILWLVVTIGPDSGPGYWLSYGWWSLSSRTQALAILLVFVVVTIVPDSGPGRYPVAGGHYRPGPADSGPGHPMAGGHCSLVVTELIASWTVQQFN